MICYDYTFCMAETCGNTLCFRHISHAPVGEPFSIANFEPECEDYKEKDEEDV